MFASALLAAAFQIGPFYQQKPGYAALRPLCASELEDTDVLWPVFTSHRDWWRFCLLAHWQAGENGSYQFDISPVWFNGVDRGGESYWGLFPLYGHHPHVMLVHDLDFALWPLWTRYSMPRGGEDGRMTTNSVLFPFFSWRDDGSWSFWPVCGVNRQRESVHRYVFWPLFTWASYREDRDTAGEGSSWMLWPLFGRVDRAREKQTLVLPPFFSSARAGGNASETSLRCPWPFFGLESGVRCERISLWPLYEHVHWRSYSKGESSGDVTRFGWKLVELYDDETRVFPFFVSGRGYFRLWPFWESEEEGGVSRGRFLSLVPIRNIPQIDRNWAKFWTFYEREETPVAIRHSLFWGIIRWGGVKW